MLPSWASVFSLNSPVSVSTIAIVCCLACRSQPTIFISASFVPSLWVRHHKVYSGPCEADVVMTSVGSRHSPYCAIASTVAQKLRKLSARLSKRGATEPAHEHLAGDVD